MNLLRVISIMSNEMLKSNPHTVAEKRCQDAVLFLGKLFDRTITRHAHHSVRDSLLQLRCNVRVAKSLHHAFEGAHEVLHEVVNTAGPTAEVPLQTRSHHAPSRPGPVAYRGVGVLWTTHLLDEIEPTDHILVLHLGKPLAHGIVGDVVAASGTDTLRAAFAALTKTADAA